MRLNCITKSFAEVRVLRDVSLSVDIGETAAVCGPSGSGKTTLLRLIAGLERPDSGTIEIDGKVVSKRAWSLSPHRRDIGMVFQTPALWPHMSVARNILFGLSDLSRDEAHARLDDLLERTGIVDLARRHPEELSAGQARRVALARALAPRPKRLLLDEPLVNLDVDLKEQMRRLILDSVRETHATLIIVTHDPDEAAGLADRTFVLRDGILDA